MALTPILAASAALAQNAAVYVVSYVDVAPAASATAGGLLRVLATASRKDDGNMRFEALQRTAPPNQFAIVSIWRDQKAYDAHAANAHGKEFRDKIKPHLISAIDDRLHGGMEIAAPAAKSAPGAVFVVTHVDVPPPRKDDCISALKALVEDSRKEGRRCALRDIPADQSPEPFLGGRNLAKSERVSRAYHRGAHQKIPRAAYSHERRALRRAAVQGAVAHVDGASNALIASLSRPLTQQRVRAGARTLCKQQRHVVRCVDIEGNAREAHHDRLDATRLRLGEMRREAVVAEPQRHRVGRRTDDGIRSAFVPRRHDDKAARAALEDLAADSQQALDVLGLQKRDVGRQREHVAAERGEPRSRCSDRGGMSVVRLFVRDLCAVAGGDAGGTTIDGDDQHRGELARRSKRRQHVLEHRVRELLPLRAAESSGEPLLGFARFLDWDDRTDLAMLHHAGNFKFAALN
jgi:quinol monooxygenase YgiN